MSVQDFINHSDQLKAAIRNAFDVRNHDALAPGDYLETPAGQFMCVLPPMPYQNTPYWEFVQTTGADGEPCTWGDEVIVIAE